MLLFLLYFLLIVFLAFYVPGTVLLRRLHLSFFQNAVLGVVLGMALWGWQGMIFGYIGLRWLSYIYLLIFFILWIRVFIKVKQHHYWFKFKFSGVNLIILCLIFIGTLTQSIILFFNGFITDQGMYFCCGNHSDNLFHLSLTNQIIEHFPPYQPGMSGVFTKNYHYWSNLVVAELARVFNFPLIAAQFQFFTVLISLLLGLTAVIFSQIIKIGKTFAIWLIFFLYLGGDLVYLLHYFAGQGIDFTMSSMEDGTKFLVNPPRAFSIVFFMTGLSLFTIWIKRKDFLSGLLMAMVFGSVIGFKVYTGIFILSGLAILGLYFLLRKNFRMLAPLISTLVFSLIIYLPVNKDAGGLYFTGFWLFENFIVQPSLGLERLELERRIFLEDQKWWRVMQYHLYFFIVYIFAIFGSKLIGFAQTKNSLLFLPRELHILLFSGIIFSAVGGFFFQQTSGGANSFNFLVSIFIIGSIYTALACFYWTKRLSGKLKYLFIIFVVAATIPRSVVSVMENVDFLFNQDGFTIPHAELRGYNYLNKNGMENPLVLVDKRGFDMNADSPYISFLINGKLYFSGIGILHSHGIDVEEREQFTNLIFNDSNKDIVRQALIDTSVAYIIMRPDEVMAVNKPDFLKLFYENEYIKIIKVIK